MLRTQRTQNHQDHPCWDRYTFVDGISANGIPCQAAFVWHRAYKGSRVDGLQIEPDEPAGYDEVLLFDRKGYRAIWLEERVDANNGWDEVDMQIRENRERSIREYDDYD